MDRLEHLEHLDKHLADELAQVARETIRDELKQQTRKQRRTAMLYAASGTVALYAGAALALAVGLALALVLPDWAAALITAALLAVAAYALRGAARTEHTPAHDSGSGHVVGGTPPAGPPGGLGTAYPPMPPVAPGVTGVPGARTPAPGRMSAPAPRTDDVDPENPRHRA
ncbi:phage holin family protein [Streptomyces sp.]|uniref:phage holin family protein n=1 Tax=Streptomyces sp. TaxID=1931 RepID=UPI002D754D45|nr:phage holin family protein [Streptomyces sp.]HZF88170.1 phage holin family protein [Streptomyces sp.]